MSRPDGPRPANNPIRDTLRRAPIFSSTTNADKKSGPRSTASPTKVGQRPDKVTARRSTTHQTEKIGGALPSRRYSRWQAGQ
jgi:hypothetical protein